MLTNFFFNVVVLWELRWNTYLSCQTLCIFVEHQRWKKYAIIWNIIHFILRKVKIQQWPKNLVLFNALSSLVWHINLHGLINAKAIPVEVNQWYYSPGRIKGFNTFPKRINRNVNITARLEFKLAFFEAAVPHFSLWATGRKNFK